MISAAHCTFAAVMNYFSKIYLLTWMLVWSVAMSVMAQKSCVIADAETHVPLKDVLIHTDNDKWARTDYMGYWTIKGSFVSAEVKRPGYLTTRVKLETLPDTLFMIPAAKQLKEVEIWGEYERSAKNMNEMIRKDAAQHGDKGLSGNDFLGFLDRRANRDKRHLEQAKRKEKEENEKKTWEDVLKEAYDESQQKK